MWAFFCCPFAAFPISQLLALFCCVCGGLTSDTLDSTCTACAAGEGRCGGLLGCFWRATLCSFDLKCGWSLSFLDSIMMCVVLFSPFLSALQTENARQSQELSLTLCCSRCDLFRIAVKISECVRFGQNVGFGR